jgi:uncharacterized protein (DUF885 family)
VSRRLGLLLLGGAVGALIAATVRPHLFRPSAATRAPVAPSGLEVLGAERYARRLAELAGVGLEPAAVARRARAERESLEVRLDAAARAVEPGAADWRPVFERLRGGSPASEREVVELYRDEIARAWSFCRDRIDVPMAEAPAEVVPIGNDVVRRLFPIALLLEDGRLGVTTRGPAAVAATADDLANQCRVCVPPVVVHETCPGHQVAFAAARRAGRRPAAAAEPFFHEGWAQYAEVLADEAGYWRGAPARELGALRLRLLRALRAEVDVGLHADGWTADAARASYRELALVPAAAAEAELAGHLEQPGRKCAYLVGAAQILALRAALGEPRGEALRAFHDRLLAEPGRLPAIARERFGVALAALP